MEEFFELLDQLKESKNVKRVTAHYRQRIRSLPAQMINAFAGVLPQTIEDIRDAKHLLHILYLVHDTLMLTKPSSLDPQLWSEVMEALVPRYCQLAGQTRDKDNLRKMHGNWAKIRVFEQALLRKLGAAIEGQHPGKRGREEDGDSKPPDKKLAAATTIAMEEDAAAKAEVELAVFRGSEVLHKLHHQLRLPARTQLWAFYIYHLVTTSTALPTDYREAPAAAVAALLLACKIRDTFVPLKRLIEKYEDDIPQHLKALHVRHCLRERILRIESRAVCLLGFEFDLPDPMTALEAQWTALQAATHVRQRCVDIAHSRPYLYSSIIYKYEPAVVAAAVLRVATELEKRTMPDGWAGVVGVDEQEVAAAVSLLKEWAGQGGEGGKLLDLSIRADPFQHRAASTPASTTGSESSSSRTEPETPAILQQLLQTGRPSPVSIRDFLPV